MKKVLVFGVAILLGFSSCLTAARRDYDRFVEALPEVSGTVFQNVHYSDKGKQCVLDIFWPEGEPSEWESDPAPVYVFVHGGAWLMGSKEFIRMYDETVVKPLRSQGVIVVSVGYRFFGQTSFKNISRDVHDAMEFLRANQKIYRLDMSRVVIHGQSAGAHLAMLEAFRHPEGIRLIINEYGPADLITMQKDQPAVGIVSRKIRRAESPVEWVRSGLPRMVIYHGDADELVPFSQTEELIDGLESAGVPFELNVIEGADHGFMNQTQEVRDEIAGRICNEITAALGI